MKRILVYASIVLLCAFYAVIGLPGQVASTLPTYKVLYTFQAAGGHAYRHCGSAARKIPWSGRDWPRVVLDHAQRQLPVHVRGSRDEFGASGDGPDAGT
jgi:hypothetical protein